MFIETTSKYLSICLSILVYSPIYLYQIMAYISNDKFWRNQLFNIVSAKDKVQDISFNQLKLKVNDTYKKDEKIATKFEPSNNEGVVNKAYLDKRVSKIEYHISYFEKIRMNLNCLTTSSLWKRF